MRSALGLIYGICCSSADPVVVVFWCCWLQASTGLSLKATAGLRLLPGSKADDILAAVRTYLATLPFQVKAGMQSATVAVERRPDAVCKARDSLRTVVHKQLDVQLFNPA